MFSINYNGSRFKNFFLFQALKAHSLFNLKSYQEELNLS